MNKAQKYDRNVLEKFIASLNSPNPVSIDSFILAEGLTGKAGSDLKDRLVDIQLMHNKEE